MVINEKKPGRPKKYDKTPVKFNLSFNPILKQKILDQASKKNIGANKLVMDAVNYYFKHFKEDEPSIEKYVWRLCKFFKEVHEAGIDYVDDTFMEKLDRYYHSVYNENIPENRKMIVQNMIEFIGKCPHEIYSFEGFNIPFKKLEDYVTSY